MTDSHWTSQNNFQGNDFNIHARAYDIDGNDYDASGVLKFDAFGADELAYIDLAWRQMSEDMAPFDVDVTTIEPPPSYFTNSQSGNPTAHRILFTSNYDDDEHHPGTGNFWAKRGNGVPWSGVAEPSSWGISTDSPAFVFVNGYDGMPRDLWNHPDTGADWGPIQEYIGLVGSHEVGHVMGLGHDGVTSQNAAVNGYLGNPANGYMGDTEYYAGHTTGATDAATSWGTIMGGSELRSLTQWSKGEYLGGGNSEDDLAQIAGHLGYRIDDHGGSLTGDLLLPSGATSLSFTDGFTSAAGIIERSSSTTNDYDVFEIDLGSTAVSSTIRIDTPAPVIVKQGTGVQVNVEGNFVGVSNLDVEMRIYAEGNLNTPLYTINPDDLTNAVHTFSGSGKYYVVVDGVGYSPAIGVNYGYSDYGSLGQYTLSGFLGGPKVTNLLARSTAYPEYGDVDFSTSFSTSFSTRVGNGRQIARLQLAFIDEISVVFSEDVETATVADFKLTGLRKGLVPSFTVAYDAGTRTATLALDVPLVDEQYILSVYDTLTDADDNPLDGDWINPATAYSRWFGDGVTPSVFPSGDGVDGGDMNFGFTILAPGYSSGPAQDAVILANFDDQYGTTITPVSNGSQTLLDFNRDGIISQADRVALAQALIDQAVDETDRWVWLAANADFNEEAATLGVVSSSAVDDDDINLLIANWLQTVDPYENGDANGDGFVDLQDVYLLTQQYGLEFNVALGYYYPPPR